MRWLLLLALSFPAFAATTVSIDSINVEDQELRELSCDLTSGGLFASMQVAAAVAAQKPAFDACKPTGGAFRTSWAWAGGATSGVTVTASSAPAADACIAKALQAVTSSLTGTCRATILVGDKAGAEAAAAALAPPSQPAP